jgi:hypothetical protein
MSNQACLFAEDTPAPCDPFAEGGDPGANTVPIAGAADQVPAFWLCCFDKGDVAVVESEEGAVSAPVSEMARVRSRLAERDALVRQLFPLTPRPGMSSAAPSRRPAESTSRSMPTRSGCSTRTRANSAGCSRRR